MYRHDRQGSTWPTLKPNSVEMQMCGISTVLKDLEQPTPLLPLFWFFPAPCVATHWQLPNFSNALLTESLLASLLMPVHSKIILIIKTIGPSKVSNRLCFLFVFLSLFLILYIQDAFWAPCQHTHCWSQGTRRPRRVFCSTIRHLQSSRGPWPEEYRTKPGSARWLLSPRLISSEVLWLNSEEQQKESDNALNNIK